ELVQKHLGQYAAFENEAFTALNTAFAEDGVLIHVPDNTVIEEPIHFINLTVSEDSEIVSHPRNLFVAGKNSQLTIIDTYHCLADSTYFNNVVTEFFVDENANVDHIKIQEESVEAFHIMSTHVQQERSSVYTNINIDLGGLLVRNNFSLLLNAENCESHLFGFYFGEDRQHVDNHTFMDHAKPHCFSNELYKGILGGKARGVFNGKILVRPNAQKTNALQSNKSLLLTGDATINAKPQLEIFADDVKCTHGATIGQLDEEAMFYLRSRGISEEMVAAMLRYAFAADVFENIKIESIRKKLDTRIIDILKKVEGLGMS
ncbi:Fe-S cluster assembly protein SufD, partial [candidate division KSB1 bacterium]|nr:Fe-S cluster assembly protein SufD [candidate division KSB1 bacterium]